MQGYRLNAELISNKKFNKISLDEIKKNMESREDFIAFYSIFMDYSMQMNFSDFIEIYIEDFFMDIDLQNDIQPMLKDLDKLIPGGLSNDSKIEWSSGLSPITVVWYKDNNTWTEKISESEIDFIDEDWTENEDYDSDPYEGRYPKSLDDDDNW